MKAGHLVAGICGVILLGAATSTAMLTAATTFAAEPTQGAAAESAPASPAPATSVSVIPPINNGAATESAAPSSASKLVPNSAQKTKAAKLAKSPDRLELDKTVVTGNRELPKVLYIVPWKKAGLGDLPAQPFNTLLDEALTPVDRDVFTRELHYYDALEAGAGHPAASDQGEK